MLLALLPAVLLAQAPKPVAQPAPKAAPAAKAATAQSAPKPAAAAAGTPATDEEKTIYSIGVFMYRSLSQFDLTPAEFELVQRGLKDAAAGKPAVDLETWGPKINALARERGAKVAQRAKAASVAYLDKAAAEPGAVKTASGMVYREVKAGEGASPSATDTVKVHYRGTLTDGKEFDSSYRRNEPAQFPLNGVIKCWTEGLQKMKAGGKAVLTCPSDLAYGDSGRPPVIPPGATLIFEVELLEVAPPAAAAPAPAPAPATK